MDYEKEYKKLKAGISNAYLYAQTDSTKAVLENILPELKESEDERVRKGLVKAVSRTFEGNKLFGTDVTREEALAWLEKQGEKLPVGFYYVNSEGKKFYSDTFKYGNVTLHVEKQSEKKPFDYENQETQNGHKFNIGDIISNGKVEFRVDNIVKNCIGQDCYSLVDVKSEKNGTRYFQLTNSEGKTYNSGETTWLCKQVDAKFEKQGEQKPADKVEPKFHEGDWVVVSTTKGDIVVQIASVEYFKDGHPSYFTTDGRWFGNGTKARLLTDKDVETITLPESKVVSEAKVEPKFPEGEWIIYQGTENIYQIVARIDNQYQLRYGDNYTIQKCADVEKNARLWDITIDAKDGDVLVGKIDGDDYFLIFMQIKDGCIETYGHYYGAVDRFCAPSQLFCRDYKGIFYPATKEQRDTLFAKMKEAGYEWNEGTHELKKIDDNEVNGEDYGIDSLYHAQRILEKTLGSVEGYQSDDGILDHKAAITAVKKLYEQKPAWSEDDEKMYRGVMAVCDVWSTAASYYPKENEDVERLKTWLESLKQRIGE